MKKQDLLQFEQLLDRKLNPIKDLLQKHEITLYGPEGNNGLNTYIKTLSGRIRRLEFIGAGAQAIMGGLAMFHEKLFGK